MIKISPHCDPLPIPSYADVQTDMQRIGAFLSGVQEDDDRFAVAARLLTPQPEGGPTRLERLCKAAYDYAYQLGDAAGADVHEFFDDIVAITYDLAQRGADEDFPLRFHRPGVFVTTLEIADARRRLERGADSLISSRQLARLARMDEAAMDALLEAEDNTLGVFGFSAREYAEMDDGDYNYWCGQRWVDSLGDVPDWLGRLPGFIPTRATVAAD